MMWIYAENQITPLENPGRMDGNGTGSRLQTLDRREQAAASLQGFLAHTTPGPVRTGGNPDNVYVVSDALVGAGPKQIGEAAARFTLEGDYGFAVGVRSGEKPPIWLGITSFLSGSNIVNHRTRTAYPPNVPVILQLQGIARGKTYEEHPELERQARKFIYASWETAAITVMRDWVKEAGLPRIGLYPIAMNRHYDTKISREVAKRRYEDPARQVGMTPDSNGIFMLDLKPSNGRPL